MDIYNRPILDRTPLGTGRQAYQNPAIAESLIFRCTRAVLVQAVLAAVDYPDRLRGHDVDLLVTQRER